MASQEGPEAARPPLRWLTALYVCALGSIAVLVIAGQAALHSLIDTQASDSHLINLAGRQRMLSQRIAKAALAQSAAPDAESRDRYGRELADAAAEWKSAHASLAGRGAGGGPPGENSPEIARLFAEMQPHFDALAAAAEAPAAGGAAPPEVLRRILEHEARYLDVMERAVARYEAEASSRVARLRTMETRLAGAALAILLLEALLVFRPAASRIKALLARSYETEMERKAIAEELSAVFDSVPALILYHDRDGRIVRVNRSGAEILGASMYRLERSSIYELFPGQEAQSRAEDGRVYATGQPLLGLLRSIRNYEGAMRWLRMNKVPYRDVHGGIAGIILFAVDVSAHKRLERRLMDLTADAERRLGYDLHDGLGQHLSGILYLSKRLQNRLAGKQAEEEAQAAEILSLVKEAVATVRNMAKGLRPLGDHPSDLSQGLADLAAATQAATGIPCDYEAPRSVLVLDPPEAEHLYRIAQEALSNAVRHSQASRITIRLEQLDDVTRLAVTDDGAGFAAVERKPDGQDGGGMGLSIMEHRTQLLGGRFRIESAPGAGTRVLCEIEA